MYVLFAFFTLFTANAQDPCEWVTQVKDSLGDYRATRESLIYERDFAGNASYIYFSLAEHNGLPVLNVTMVSKSEDFIKAQCLDGNSKIYLQLDNGKIVTLLHTADETCGTSVRNGNVNNRVMNGYFVFRKDTFEDLQKSPVSLMRIKFATETADYVVKSQLKSSLEKKTVEPALYFIRTLACLDR